MHYKKSIYTEFKRENRRKEISFEAKRWSHSGERNSTTPVIIGRRVDRLETVLSTKSGIKLVRELPSLLSYYCHRPEIRSSQLSLRSAATIWGFNTDMELSACFCLSNIGKVTFHIVDHKKVIHLYLTPRKIFDTVKVWQIIHQYY